MMLFFNSRKTIPEAKYSGDITLLKDAVLNWFTVGSSGLVNHEPVAVTEAVILVALASASAVQA